MIFTDDNTHGKSTSFTMMNNKQITPNKIAKLLRTR